MLAMLEGWAAYSTTSGVINRIAGIQLRNNNHGRNRPKTMLWELALLTYDPVINDHAAEKRMKPAASFTDRFAVWKYDLIE